MPGIDWYDWCGPKPTNKVGVHDTRCKHGSESCEQCGTTERRDFVHHTQGGQGSVARLFKKRGR